MEKVCVSLLLLLISSKSTLQQFAGCRESYYLHGTECKACPDRCETCASELNCSSCKGNSFGPVCQYTCQQGCKDLCHKIHGYCTFGCPDGLFPVPDSPLCDQCPTKCKICKSFTDCAECIPGYYGKTCDSQCPSNCKTCNKTTGACLVCEGRYFNQDGNCRGCQDGCASCTDNNNCLSCQAGYLNLNEGHCIMECPIPSKLSDLDQTFYSKEVLTSQGCTKLTKGQTFVVETRKPCIQYVECSSKISCQSEFHGNFRCGTIKAHQCSHSCHQLNESYCLCNPKSSCTVIETLSSMSFCVTNKEAFSVLKLSPKSECVSDPEEDPPMPLSVALSLFVAQSVVVLLLCISLLMLIFLWKKRYYKKWKSWKAQRNDVEECIDLQPAEQVKYEESKESLAEAELNRLSQKELKVEDTSCVNESDSPAESLLNEKTKEQVLRCVDQFPSASNVDREFDWRVIPCDKKYEERKESYDESEPNQLSPYPMKIDKASKLNASDSPNEHVEKVKKEEIPKLRSASAVASRVPPYALASKVDINSYRRNIPHIGYNTRKSCKELTQYTPKWKY